MIERTLTWEQLDLKRDEIIEALKADDATCAEVDALLDEIASFLQVRFAFVTTAVSTLDRFNPGRIILAQLKGSEALCYFVATAGKEFEDFQHRLANEGDMVRVYLANEIGSMIAERAADQMEQLLQAQLSPKGLSRTNRFSPGYCGWHVKEQPLLFAHFAPEPCGIHLTDSCLMIPIKSVSGVIGIGHNVRRQEYTCGFCKLESCYKKKKKA